MILRHILQAVLLLAVIASPCLGQFQRAVPNAGGLGDSETQYWQVGFTFAAPAGSCRGIVATQSIPMEWPEQTVKLVEKDISPSVKVTDRVIDGAVKRMVVEIPSLRAGSKCHALLTFAVTRSHILAPRETDQYQAPSRTRLDSKMRGFLLPSPYIESNSTAIRSLAKQVGRGAPDAWSEVEAIYDWVRENVQFVDDQGIAPKTTAQTLKDRTGDCDEMSSLFIAICRAAGIPARFIQVPGHAYPEFYLLDADGVGHWFPCQASGTRAFGSMPEFRPVLQKGDNLMSPHAGRRKYRILPSHITAASGQPSPVIVVQQVER